jgi:hypothetical protein
MTAGPAQWKQRFVDMIEQRLAIGIHERFAEARI